MQRSSLHVNEPHKRIKGHLPQQLIHSSLESLNSNFYFWPLRQTAIGSEMTHLSSGNPRRNSEDKMYILCCPLPAACLLSRKIAFFKSRIEVDFRESLPLPLLLPLPHFQRRCEQGKLQRLKGGSPGLVVMEGDSCSKGCEFESWH